MRDHQTSFARADYEGFEEEPLGYQQYGRVPHSRPRSSGYVRDFEENYRDSAFSLAEEAEQVIRFGKMRKGNK